MKKLAEGREAEIFDVDSTRVLKLYREGSEGACVREWLALGVLDAGLAPTAFELRHVDGRSGILMERISGTDVLTLIGAQPWRLPGLGILMGTTHARVHELTAPAALPPLRDRMRSRIELSPFVPDGIRTVAIAAIADLKDGDRVCHGDFHPGNLLSEKKRARVLDWPNASAGEAAADVAASVLILQLGEPTETSPWAVRKLHRLGRGLLIGRYLAGYRRRGRLDQSDIEKWMLPVAVDRLSHGIPQERESLLAVIADLT